jgi:uncharacterized protein (TIGR03118 family)
MTHLRLLAWSVGPGTLTRALAIGALLSTLGVAGCGGGGDGDDGAGAPALTISASPSTIALGEDTTLTWTSSSGTSCTASGGWSGSKAATGTETVTPDAIGSVTYTLTCSGGIYSGDATASTTVTVEAPSAFSATALIADTAGTGALTTDASVANAWGLAFGPTTPLWVANNATQTSTVYDGNGKRQPLAAPLVVRLPPPTAGVPFAPTGIVFNGSTDFVVSGPGTSGPARFIFAGQGGAIAGWSPTVDTDDAVITYVADDGAEYTGLAIGVAGGNNVLYAADFANGKVDVFDASYEKQPTSDTSFAFADPELPEGYAPFGIQAIANGAGGAMQVYVAYARRDAGNDEEVGAGLGIVNVFDANGALVTRLVSDGAQLDAPWGIALAPPDFGTLGDTLLVGNFGDGRINAFDPGTGELVGTIANAAGEPFEVPGLWGIAFGNDVHNQPHATLFYAAGINGEVNGVVGRLDVGDAPPVLNEPPVVAITAPAAGNVSGTVTVTATATSDTNVANVEFFAGTTSLGTVTTPPYSVQWDTTTVDDGAVDLTARATDTSGNVGTSPAVTVMVANTAPAVTLSQLQATVFTPICSVCHNGSAPPGGLLPGSMDLRDGQTHGSLVGVQSQEVPGLMRVAPGDPEQSYVIHKLEGRAGIVGDRMPFGGPFLDDATIDQVRSWIASGAPNN